MPAARPYDALLAKGEDRKQRILDVAQRLLTRHGWRNTTLAQIAREAGVTPAGLLHHFESKEQLLHAVLDARDFDDETHADRGGDLFGEIAQAADRFARAPELVGTFTVLLAENILPEAPLHDRLLARHRDAIDIVAEAIRRGQAAGQYRTDLNPAVKAVEILAFVHGMETIWLLDPSIPLTEVFKEYAEALARDFAPPTIETEDMRYRLDVVAASVADVVQSAGGWLFDRAMAGWDVTVLVADRGDEQSDDRPLQILGAQALDLEYALAARASGVDTRPNPQAVAVAADLFGCDERIRQGVLQALDQGVTEVTLWGETWPAELEGSVGLVEHRLSMAAQTFKAQALAAALAVETVPQEPIGHTETFRSGLTRAAEDSPAMI